MTEDPKKLTRAHKIALGVISAACCCLIGISAFTLAAPDALSQVQDNQAEATQEADSASTDYGNDAPQEGQSDNATQDGNTQDESSSASGSQSKNAEKENGTSSNSGNKASSSSNSSSSNGNSQGATRYPFPVALPTDAFRAAPTPPSRRALPPTMPCAPPAFRLARRAASTGST